MEAFKMLVDIWLVIDKATEKLRVRLENISKNGIHRLDIDKCHVWETFKLLKRKLLILFWFIESDVSFLGVSVYLKILIFFF